MKEKNNILKFIELKQEVRKITEKADLVNEQAEVFEKDVRNQVKLIRSIQAKINKGNTGNVWGINNVSTSHLFVEVSYCGCCDNEEESIELELLTMDEDTLNKHFTKKRNDYLLERKKEDEEKERENIKNIEKNEKETYLKLKRKYEN